MTHYRLNKDWFAERPYIIALFITLILVLWMLSGVMNANELPDSKSKQVDIIAKVKVETLHAEVVNDNVTLYGRTEPQQTATLKAEIYGKIEKVLAKRGAPVKKGDVIAHIATNDLDAKLAYSRSLLKQREIEYKGALKLNADGYQGQVQVSGAEANLAAAKAEVKRLEIALANTVIRAPFDGVMNTRYIEEGDYVQIGDNIAMIADLQPLVVRGFVTEKQVSQLAVNQQANIQLLDKGQVSGHLRYIASVADEETNTFKVEVTIDNPDLALLAGISSEINIPLKAVDAIKISPALLALDESGNIGVKTVDNNKVVFTPIAVVKSESGGIWLSGLGKQADVITLGQGFVRAGDTVNPVYATDKL